MSKQLQIDECRECKECSKITPAICGKTGKFINRDSIPLADCPLPDYVDMEGKVAVDAELWEWMKGVLEEVAEVNYPSGYCPLCKYRKGECAKGCQYENIIAILSKLEGKTNV